MKNISKILIPFDNTSISDNALDYALHFIHRHADVKIYLMHIKSSETTDEDIANMKAQAEQVKSCHPAFRDDFVWLIKTGTLTQSIMNAQQEKNIELIIMGTGGTEEEDQESDTNTSRLVLEAMCPIIVVPASFRDFILRKVALVLGKKEIEDAQVLEVLLRIARRFNAEVQVLTIFNKEDKDTYTDTDEKNESMLEYYLNKFYAIHAFKQAEDIEKGIFEYVKNKEIDLLAILPRNHAKKSEPSKGRLTKLLTMHTKVPLITLE